MLSVLSQVNQVWCSFFFDANFTKEQILQILQSERKNTLFLLLIFFCSWIKWSKLLSPLILFINTYSVLTRQELFYWKYNSTLWLATKTIYFVNFYFVDIVLYFSNSWIRSWIFDIFDIISNDSLIVYLF